MSVYIKEKEHYLKESIDSMLNQTIMPNEIVIVKDGQLTPELNQMLDDYKDVYPELFKIIESEKNIGLGRALDLGLKECQNELVARMDSDDISLPDRCELQLKEFNNDKNISIIGSYINEFYDEPSNIVNSRVVPTEHEEIVKYIKRRSPFNHPTVMYKKDAVISSGGYGHLRRKQDLDLFSRMLNNGCIARNIPKALLLFRSNKANYMRRKSWTNCKSYIYVQYVIYKRGHCSLKDLLFVSLSQLAIFALPMFIFQWVSDRYLRVSVAEKTSTN